MTATSFSIATTWPLTTAPSLISAERKDSSRSAAKSSRLGARCCNADIQSPKVPQRGGAGGVRVAPRPGLVAALARAREAFGARRPLLLGAGRRVIDDPRRILEAPARKGREPSRTPST